MPGPVNEHLERVVLPALRDYWAAEADLTSAALNRPGEVHAAREEAMRRARTAAIELHHLCDVALKATDPSLPAFANMEEVRAAVGAECLAMRTSRLTADVPLLRDVAEAFKHHELDRKNARVTGADTVVACQTGYGTLGYGEGKYGGIDQVVVTDKAGGQRALSSVLQNVADAWRRVIGRSLPPINDFAQ
jgi:hypothetical protein